MAKDKNFFDTESPIYSAKRYVDKPVNYIQFFFKERLRLTIKLISKTFNGKNNLSFLDIGCADGIVVDEIAKAFPTIFSSFIGIDTAPAMIAVAVKKYAGKPYVFKVRDDFSDISEKDVIVETGVINYTDLSTELDFAYARLTQDSVYVISLAGTSSLVNNIKKEDAGFRHFLSYAQYEREIRKKFEIIRTIPVGLFIPFIWKLPLLARIISSLEIFLRPIAPNLFHEKIYLLKKK